MNLKRIKIVLGSVIVFLSVITSCYGVVRYARINNSQNYTSNNNSNVKIPDDNGKQQENKNDDPVNNKTNNGNGNQNQDPVVKEGMEIVPINYSEIDDFISSPGKHMVVIGQEGCHYCELFEPVVKSLSLKYKFDYMYVDIKALESEDVNKFFTSGLTIPSKCSDSGEKRLDEGFGTPLTLFTENGRTYDCVRGYTEEPELLDELRNASFLN